MKSSSANAAKWHVRDDAGGLQVTREYLRVFVEAFFGSWWGHPVRTHHHIDDLDESLTHPESDFMIIADLRHVATLRWQ